MTRMKRIKAQEATRLTESLPLINRTPLGGRISTPVSHSPTGQEDSTSEFLSLLEQQIMDTNARNTGATVGVSNEQSPPLPSGASITPAVAQLWASSLMHGLPVPGLDNENNTDSTDNADAWNPGSDTFLSTYALLQRLQGNRPSLSANTSNDLSHPQPTIEAAVEAASAKYGLPKNLILAVINQESGMDPNAVSAAGAQGLMQLMPETARSLGVTNPFDPVQNVDAGTRYLSDMVHEFGNIPLALAAYNAGPGAVQSYGGIPPYAETQNYVKSIMAKASL